MGASIRSFLSLHQRSHVGVARKFRRQILLHSVVTKSDKARVAQSVRVLTSSNLMKVFKNVSPWLSFFRLQLQKHHCLFLRQYVEVWHLSTVYYFSRSGRGG